MTIRGVLRVLGSSRLLRKRTPTDVIQASFGRDLILHSGTPTVTPSLFSRKVTKGIAAASVAVVGLTIPWLATPKRNNGAESLQSVHREELAPIPAIKATTSSSPKELSPLEQVKADYLNCTPEEKQKLEAFMSKKIETEYTPTIDPAEIFIKGKVTFYQKEWDLFKAFDRLLDHQDASKQKNEWSLSKAFNQLLNPQNTSKTSRMPVDVGRLTGDLLVKVFSPIVFPDKLTPDQLRRCRKALAHVGQLNEANRREFVAFIRLRMEQENKSVAVGMRKQ